jgi:hypothetical protein
LYLISGPKLVHKHPEHNRLGHEDDGPDVKRP